MVLPIQEELSAWSIIIFCQSIESMYYCSLIKSSVKASNETVFEIS
jgi:hypothetical protein